MLAGRLLFVSVVSAVLLGSAVSASPERAAGLSVLGVGIVDAIDDFGDPFPNAGLFTLSAGRRPNDRAHGSLTFVGWGDFAAAWGALPVRPKV
jgi:hypothetical protein